MKIILNDGRKIEIPYRILIISDNSSKGKSFLNEMIVNDGVKIDNSILDEESLIYVNSETQSYYKDILDFQYKKVINSKYYNKNLIIIDDCDISEDEHIVTSTSSNNFINALIKEFKDSYFIINSRTLVIPNIPYYRFNFFSKELVIPYLLKDEIKTVDYNNFNCLITEDSFRDSLTTIKTQNILRVKNVNKSKEVYKMWSKILNTDCIASAHGNANILKLYNLLSNKYSICVSVDYTFDNIGTITTIKTLLKNKIPILNYYSFEMLNLLNKDWVKFSNVIDDGLLSNINKCLISILNENTPCYIVGLEDLNFEKKCKSILGRLKGILKDNFTLLTSFDNLITLEDLADKEEVKLFDQTNNFEHEAK